MRLKRVEIIKFRNFENIIIDFEKNSNFPDVFSIASKNGGGKSTLLQFIFIILHCFMDDKKKVYIQNILEDLRGIFVHDEWVKFIIEEKGKEYYLNFTIDLTHNNDFYFDTNLSEKLLEKLSNSIYLAIPESQVLHFLSEKEDRIELKKLLPNFSTYNFPTEKDILKSFDNAKEKDFEEMRLNGKYGTHYIELKDNLKGFIEGKEICESKDATKIVFKINQNNEELFLENLSHGEMRKLGIYIWLKNMVKKESIVLMDEPDIALHPKWQYDLVEDLMKWSNNSQFLLATHSPQILSSTYYKNLIYLKKKDNQTVVVQPTDTFADNDINSIITLGMGATHIPPKLEKLHFEYRKLIEDGKKDIDEAKELKEQILEWESIDSTFFKRIEMYLRFKR